MGKWKIASISWQMEDNINILEIEDDINCLVGGTTSIRGSGGTSHRAVAPLKIKLGGSIPSKNELSENAGSVQAKCVCCQFS